MQREIAAWQWGCSRLAGGWMGTLLHVPGAWCWGICVRADLPHLGRDRRCRRRGVFAWVVLELFGPSAGDSRPRADPRRAARGSLHPAAAGNRRQHEPRGRSGRGSVRVGVGDLAAWPSEPTKPLLSWSRTAMALGIVCGWRSPERIRPALTRLVPYLVELVCEALGAGSEDAGGRRRIATRLRLRYAEERREGACAGRCCGVGGDPDVDPGAGRGGAHGPVRRIVSCSGSSPPPSGTLSSGFPSLSRWKRAGGVVAAARGLWRLVPRQPVVRAGSACGRWMGRPAPASLRLAASPLSCPEGGLAV